jgi:hypothetical protein
MDLVAGRETTLGKVKFLEILASVPYQAWENRLRDWAKQPTANAERMKQNRALAAWAREAKENENWHLTLVSAKMRADGVKDPWYLSPVMRWPAVLSYVVASWLLARFKIRRAFLLNGEFEDHAERVYARFVADNPQWEQQPVEDVPLQGYPELRTWADVFRRIALDERNHRNTSYVHGGKPELILPYDGMPQRD